MTPLLEHRLIQKYFSCDAVNCDRNRLDEHRIKSDECMSYRILKAMEGPIKPGEKYIEVSLGNLELKEWEDRIESFAYFCPQIIRLPDEFQPRQGKKPSIFEANCPSCNEKLRHECATETAKCNVFSHSVNCSGEPDHIVPKPDPVEEKIEELVEFFGAKGARNANEAIRKVFRELVALARTQK